MKFGRINREVSICLAILFLAGAAFSQSTLELDKKIIDLNRRLLILEAKVAKLEGASNGSPAVSTQPTATINSGNLITAKLFKKKLQMAQPGEVQDNLALLITFKNNSYKDIVGFKSEVVLKTVAGDSLMTFEVDINKPISKNGTYSWYGGIPYNAGDPHQVRLMNMSVQTVAVKVNVISVYYSDGTSQTFRK